jgi:omega-amidase
MEELKIALIQSDLYWEDPKKNIESFSKIIDTQIHFPVDIIFLPEMFTTGFSINLANSAEEMNGPSIHFLQETAQKRNCRIITSLFIREEKKLVNRLVIVSPDGSYHYSDKRHLFRLSEEYKVLTPGKKKIIENIQGWNVFPLICYDLRFPVWSKNTFNDEKYEYDVLVYISNWPTSRSDVWKSLLIARAIENLSYVVGVNRIGRDGFGTAHTGDSMVINPKGEILFSAEPNHPAVAEISLSMSELRKIRETYPFGQDWDHFTIKP